MKTKLISMLLACIMLVSLAACADDNDKPSSTPEESTKETDVQTTEDVTTEEDTTEPEETGWQGPGKNPDMEYCRHGMRFLFDDETMTFPEVYGGIRVQDVVEEIEFWSTDHDENEKHHVKIFYDGEEVTEGYLQVGMLVQVYHDDVLYGEYQIDKLNSTHANNTMFSTYGGYYFNRIDKKFWIPDNTLFIQDLINDPFLSYEGISPAVFLGNDPVIDGYIKAGMIVRLTFDDQHTEEFTVWYS